MTKFSTKCPLNLDITVKVGDKFRNVVFSIPMVYGNPLASTFTTSDKELIEALKNHRDFGKAFFIEEEILDATEGVSSSEFAVKTIEDDLADPENAIIVESVTTKGMAVAYIQGMYGESFTATTVEDMKREAAQKWNVIFPKWGK